MKNIFWNFKIWRTLRRPIKNFSTTFFNCFLWFLDDHIQDHWPSWLSQVQSYRVLTSAIYSVVETAFIKVYSQYVYVIVCFSYMSSVDLWNFPKNTSLWTSMTWTKGKNVIFYFSSYFFTHFFCVKTDSILLWLHFFLFHGSFCNPVVTNKNKLGSHINGDQQKITIYFKLRMKKRKLSNSDIYWRQKISL